MTTLPKQTLAPTWHEKSEAQLWQALASRLALARLVSGDAKSYVYVSVNAIRSTLAARGRL